jgi:hypothetical protein
MARIGRESAPAGGARALIFVPRSLTWDTGIPAMGPFDAPPETVMRVLRENRITHVVLGDVGVYSDSPEVTRSIERVVTAHPDAFTRVWANPSFAIYRLAPPDVVAR